MENVDLNCILLVDDDPATNFLNKLIIQSAKIDVQINTCEDGQEALEYLTRQGEYGDELKYPIPDLILLDINMPRMNGWEFLHHYEQLSEDITEKVLVSMLTTSFNPDDRKRAESKECVTAFFSKPLTTEYIEQLVRIKSVNDKIN